MRTGKVVEYVYVMKDENTIYSIGRLQTPTSNVFYNIHILDRESLEWRFMKQIEVSSIANKKLKKKFIDIIGWNLLYDKEIAPFISPKEVREMNNFFIDRLFEGKIEDGKWQMGRWPQKRQGVVI